MREPSASPPGDKRRRAFRLTPLACALLFMLHGVDSVRAEDEFDMAALETSGPKLNVDLSKFANTGSELPGRYLVEVYINHQLIDSRVLEFVQNKKGQLTPLLSATLLEQWG